MYIYWLLATCGKARRLKAAFNAVHPKDEEGVFRNTKKRSKMRDRKKKKIFHKGYKGQFKAGKTMLSFVTMFMILSLGLFFLSQSNQATMKGYSISDLEKKKQELADEREKLEVEAARLQSIQGIQKDVTKTDMVPVKKVNYVNASTGVAVNR